MAKIKNIDCRVFFQPSVYSSLLVDVDTLPEFPNVQAVKRHSDVLLMFDAKRLQTLGSTTSMQVIEEFKQNLSRSSSSPQLSDADLMSFIRSRRIQSPSEIRDWSQFIDDVQTYSRLSKRKTSEPHEPGSSSSSKHDGDDK